MSFTWPKVLDNCSTGLGLDESSRTIPSSLCNGQAGVNSSLGNSTPNISEEINFVKHSSSDRNYTYCANWNLPQVAQKKQPSNTNLPQEVAVTVTRTNHDVVSENAGTYFHCSLTLTSLVTKQNLDSLTTGQTAKQQHSNSLKKRTAALKHKQLCGWN